MNQLRNMGEATWYSFTQALNTFMSFLPSLLVALIVLVAGWFIAGFLARLIARGLNAIGMERAVERSGIGRFIEQSGSRWTMSEIIAALIKWSIFLIFIQAAASLVGMAQITTIINSVILFIPKLIVALGNPAMQALLDTKIGITKMRGQFQDYPRVPGIKVLPTFHPAYLLRSPDKKREAWDDLKMVRAFLRGEL